MDYQKRKCREDERRKQRNRELAKAFREGLPIEPVISAEATWYPPRPMIKKDKEAIRKLMGQDHEKPDVKPVDECDGPPDWVGVQDD